MSSILENSKSWLILWLGLAVIAILIIMGVLFWKPAEKKRETTGAIQVVAAENLWGNIAAQIGGNRVEVTSIISDPNADPHLYESDAHDAAVLASADIIIKNGLDYDDFMDKLLSVSPKGNRHILSVEKILHITGDDVNPHLWYDIPKIHYVAEAIEVSVAAQSPAQRKFFAINLKKFNDSLRPILSIIAKIKKNYPGAPVAYTERLPGYLIKAAGLTDKTPHNFAGAIEDGYSPNPVDSLLMDDLIKQHKINVLLYNVQATSPVTEHVRDLAKQAGVPVVGVTETLPANEPTYQLWQLDQVKALFNALKKGE